MIKILDEYYFETCINIACLKNKVSGTTPGSIELLRKNLAKFFQKNDDYLIFGYFNNNQLLSWMAITFHENKTRGKFWAIIAFYTIKFKNYFKFLEEHEKLLRHCIDYAENLNYNQFYYCVSEKINNTFSTQWKKSLLCKSYNYHLYDKDIIPANTKPTSELYWRMMGQETKPHNIIIKHRVKKL